MIFDDRTTIGMVRLYSKEISETLQEILTNAGKKPKDQELKLDAEFSNEFADMAQDKLDDIFQD